MNILEAIRMSCIALWSHKTRSFLTMLGIIIGIGSVVGMLAMGTGFTNFLNSQFDQLGIGTFYILPFVQSNKVAVALSAQLSYEDIVAIRQPGVAPAVEAVVVEYSGEVLANAQGERRTMSVRAVSADLFQIDKTLKLGSGRTFQADEDAAGARVAVIGKTVAQNFFGSTQGVIGQRLTLNGVGFEVIGVFDTKPGAVNVGSDPAESIFIPYHTGVGRLFRNQIRDRVDVSFVTVKARDRNLISTAVKQVERVLRERHRLTYQESDFTILNPDQFAAQAGAVIGGFSAFLGIVAGISLLVGGIGIMNIMLVSVTERTREIGLRKAVGARRRDIMWQFLIEALVLCLFGAALGIGLGHLFALGGTLILVNIFEAEGAQAVVTIQAMILATSIAAIIGIAFGLFPALQASRLSPIEALRSE